jgi:hypothetical protein
MSTTFYGRSQEVAESILKRFEDGNLPDALAPMFVNRVDHIPCRSWSWTNQLVTALAGTSDARGFDQWKKAGRSVNKGARSFHILGPCLKKFDDEKTGEEKTVVYGFKSISVFRLEDTHIIDETKWAQSSGVDHKEEARLTELPLYEVATQWGLSVQSYNGQGSRYLGMYRYGTSIALGVQNLSTWTHELCHAADDRNGTITKKNGQDPGNEIVAELGGAVLLVMLGEEVQADLGGAWEYVKGYTGKDKAKAIKKCMELINRTCAAVNLILETAQKSNSGLELAA